MTSKAELIARMETSSCDFMVGVKPKLEALLKIRIYSIEDQGELNHLAKALDQAGIDAYYYTEDRQIRGLASRMRYTDDVRTRPEFSLRYALFDRQSQTWNDNCEFQRKLRTANAAEQFNFFPKFHVESYAPRQSKGQGAIGWSFAAATKSLVNYARTHLEDPTRVRIWEPKSGEPRKVISIYVDPYARDCEIVPVKSHRLE